VCLFGIKTRKKKNWAVKKKWEIPPIAGWLFGTVWPAGYRALYINTNYYYIALLVESTRTTTFILMYKSKCYACVYIWRERKKKTDFIVAAGCPFFISLFLFMQKIFVLNKMGWAGVCFVFSLFLIRRKSYALRSQLYLRAAGRAAQTATNVT